MDASALMPVLVNRPIRERIVDVIDSCSLLTPSVLPYEIGNALTRLRKRRLLDDHDVMAAYNDFKEIPLDFLTVDFKRALIIACKYLIYAYDAYYLEVAERKRLPLLTLDGDMKKVAADLKLTVLEV